VIKIRLEMDWTEKIGKLIVLTMMNVIQILFILKISLRILKEKVTCSSLTKVRIKINYFMIRSRRERSRIV